MMKGFLLIVVFVCTCVTATYTAVSYINFDHDIHGGHGGDIDHEVDGGYGAAYGYEYGEHADSDDEHGHYDHHPEYKYSYSVKDEYTGDFKDAWEHRDGDVVKGGYSLMQPDGTTRIVEYTADAHNGFNAVVKIIGQAFHPEGYDHAQDDGYSGSEEDKEYDNSGEDDISEYGLYGRHSSWDGGFDGWDVGHDGWDGGYGNDGSYSYGHGF